MPNKKGGKSKGFISQGIHRNVCRKTQKAMRNAITPGEKMVRKQTAWLAGKNVKVTIENPDKTQTNKPFIRVSGDEYFGKGLPAKEIRPYIIRSMGVSEEV